MKLALMCMALVSVMGMASGCSHWSKSKCACGSSEAKCECGECKDGSCDMKQEPKAEAKTAEPKKK